MVNYITYQKILNLYTFLILKKEWQKHTIDYLREKYDRIFDELPNNIIVKDDNIWFELESTNDIGHKHIVIFNTLYKSYIIKWHYNRKELTNDDKKLLFMCYYFSDINQESPTHLIRKYSQLFTSFKYIKNNKIRGLLHTKYEWLVTSYSNHYKDELLPYKRLEILLKVKEKINV
jgi:hypothetical protein